MMKSIWIAILMGVALFAYGYFFSSVGHDHASHERAHQEHGEVEMSHDHSGHSHD